MNAIVGKMYHYHYPAQASTAWLATIRSVGVPLALHLGEAGADVGRQDRVDVAGAFGEVEVAAVGGPGPHRLLELVEVAGDRLAQLRASSASRRCTWRSRRRVGERAAVLGRPAEGAAEVAQLAEQQRRARVRARRRRPRRRSPRRAARASSSPSPIAGDRVLGVHVDAAEPGGRHLVEGVHDRLADLAQRRDRRFSAPPGRRCRRRRSSAAACRGAARARRGSAAG